MKKIALFAVLPLLVITLPNPLPLLDASRQLISIITKGAPMRKSILSIIALLIISLCFTPTLSATQRGILPIPPTGTEVTGDQWLFVIGINTYIHWPRLQTAVSDAQSVRDVLLSRYHYDKDHLIELYDEQATRTTILGKLRFLAQTVSEDDSLLIFYAGHGYLDPITKEGSWIPVESGTKDVSAYISNHDIKNYLKVDAIKAKHILLISDSCFSGDFFRGHRGKLPEVTDEVIKRAYRLTSRQAITSGGLEPVVDEGFGQNSIFSHFLVKTLKENSKPFLIPSNFFPDIKAGVAENAEQFPQFGSLTGTGGQQGGELVLFLKQDLRLQTLSTEISERREELDHLKRLEVAAEEVRREELAVIALHEKELAQLDAEIEGMRKRLNTSIPIKGDSLDTILEMVQQKEEQQRQLAELKRKQKEEEARRQEELDRLRAEREAKIAEDFKRDYEKYKEIEASSIDKEVKEEAWDILISKYPDAKKRIEEICKDEEDRKTKLRRAEKERKERLRRASLVKKHIFSMHYLPPPEEDPEPVLGFAYYSLPAHSIGWYIDLQLTIPEESTYDELTSSREKYVTERFHRTTILDFGITKQFTDSFSGYAGLGYASLAGVAKIQSSYSSMSYYDDPENDEAGLNLNAGLLITPGSLAINLGYNSFISGAYFGFGYIW